MLRITFQEHPHYNERRCHAFLCDVAADEPSFPFPKGSLDIIVLIFVLSAIEPCKYVDLKAHCRGCDWPV